MARFKRMCQLKTKVSAAWGAQTLYIPTRFLLVRRVPEAR
jgi:hypothetical protein